MEADAAAARHKARSVTPSDCVFCSIIHNHQSIHKQSESTSTNGQALAEKTEDGEQSTVVWENELVVIFKDKYPATDCHYQCVTRLHIPTVRSLQCWEDVVLVREMLKAGKRFLKEVMLIEVDENGARYLNTSTKTEVKFGFHVPPFRSIDHLHMHIIAGEMGFLKSMKYKEGGWHYISADQLIADLEKKYPMPEKEE